jgi:hypothetical protein
MVKVAESWQKNPHPHLKECEISPSFIMRTPFGNPWPHKNHGFKDIASLRAYLLNLRAVQNGK